MKMNQLRRLRQDLSTALAVFLLLPIFFISPKSVFATGSREVGDVPNNIGAMHFSVEAPSDFPGANLPLSDGIDASLKADDLKLSAVRLGAAQVRLNAVADNSGKLDRGNAHGVQVLRTSRKKSAKSPAGKNSRRHEDAVKKNHSSSGIEGAKERVKEELSQDKSAFKEDGKDLPSLTLSNNQEEGESLQALRDDVYKNIQDLNQYVGIIEIPADVKMSVSNLASLSKKIQMAGMPEDVEIVALKELQVMLSGVLSAPLDQKSKSYLNWLAELPWAKHTQDRYDLAKVKEILDGEHSGLEGVKKRIIEFLAVRKRVKSNEGGILLFVGPPGVGKTSIASAIAQAMGRKFVRLSLGGVSDESDIRGHNRTYQGSQPGAILQLMKRAGVNNPVMLLDEIEKMPEASGRGDARPAFLEILDPEQNNTFRDHYLEVPYDLSHVLFIVTANELDKIPAPLRDRMEIITFSGYTSSDKMAIVRNQILSKSAVKMGIDPKEIKFSKEGLEYLIDRYTSEPGVRGLTRKIEAVVRGLVAAAETEGRAIPKTIGKKDIKKYLGVESVAGRQVVDNGLGVATGLAVSDIGGSLLGVEVVKTPGNGSLNIRKQMREYTDDSSHNAYTYVKSVAEKLGIAQELFKKNNLDVQFSPASPIDGPSAGAAMATAMVSEFTGRPVKAGVAMTGEITIHGKIRAIGGLKDKVMAAHRNGYEIVIFPKENEGELAEIPAKVRREIKLVPVESMDEVLQIALAPKTLTP